MERFADKCYIRGGLCCLCEEVVVFLCDFFWRPPLLFTFIFVVANFGLSFELLRCLRCVS